jgi:hypothetical protein
MTQLQEPPVTNTELAHEVVSIARQKVDKERTVFSRFNNRHISEEVGTYSFTLTTLHGTAKVTLVCKLSSKRTHFNIAISASTPEGKLNLKAIYNWLIELQKVGIDEELSDLRLESETTLCYIAALNPRQSQQ